MKKNRLFEPYSLKGVEFKNRIAMAPMCQYSAENDGLIQNWHRVHYISRAVGQVGMIITEATAVESRGRISCKDLGIWDDDMMSSFSELVQQVQSHGCKLGIQIAHAGRKAVVPGELIVAPSAIAFNDQFPIPMELNEAEIEVIIRDFGNGVKRAVEIGVDFVEIHAAHGYLINQFLSPLTNQRTDAYGQDRSLFLKQVLEEAHLYIPKQMPVFLRVSAEDYIDEGIHPEEICRLLDPLKELIDLVHVSSGGVVENAVIKMFPGYQVAFANIIKKQLQLPVMAVGMLESPELAEKILQDEEADFIALGRELLRNPYWPLQAAKTLGENIQWPEAYQRAKP
ncbi:MAG: NADH:flavin oxidoreductase/NADH oxidase [Deltaproteobacteria bacterium]|jgi:NADPH2 dehydrogenase|nr:NADH:flavin oxidoreductase/NADH oxidase [Deltaproteobacteria bacterium]MBT4526655.1 NADH:flavin oxidoreductase/NADH oxidase [Deltaproteobacteria bacterium]